MPFDPDFLSMLAQTATYLAAAGTDNYGKTTFGAGIIVPCHQMYKTVISYGNEEENQTSNAQLIIPPPGWVWSPAAFPTITIPTVATQDQFTLADGVTRYVLWVTTYFDGGLKGGAHHQTVYLD